MAASAKANLPTKSPHARRVVDAVCLQSGQASKPYVAETFEIEIISGRSRNLRSGKSDGLRDLALQFQHVAQFTIERARPQVHIGFTLNELRSNAKPRSDSLILSGYP
jgi:hypothetical protein